MGAIDLAAEAADRAAARAPQDAEAWERVGRLRLRLMDRSAALAALEHARRLGPSVEGLLDLALAYHLAGDVGGEVTAGEQATILAPDSAEAWARSRTPWRARTGSATRSRPPSAPSSSRSDAEVAELLERLRAAAPRVLPAA
jgi:tetratricopeptide (TPR) repeat protein